MIPQFVERWLAGADVAYGIRAHREEFVLMHLARKLFYRVTRGVSDHDIVLDMAEFFLVDKRVRDYVLSTRSTFPFVRGQTGFVGFKREGIPYKRQKRIIGETHYNLLSAIRFGVAGILSSSTMPLRVLAYVGVTLFLADIAAAIAVVASWKLAHASDLLLGGLVLTVLHLGWIALALGTIGIYLARVYKDTMSLPLYVADEKHSTIPVRPHGRN
jgi:dolichol-phosphate mannosyltransferase